jgi:hypothetical protein
MSIEDLCVVFSIMSTRMKEQEKLVQYTKEELVLPIDVLDLHLPRTGKKVKFILGHNCVRLESWASLPVR